MKARTGVGRLAVLSALTASAIGCAAQVDGEPTGESRQAVSLATTRCTAKVEAVSVASPADDAVQGDLNGDGNADVVTIDFTSGLLWIGLGKGDGTFGAFTELSAPAGSGSLQLKDVNHDGKLDLLMQDSGGAAVLLGHGDGTFGAPKLTASGATPTSPTVVGDVDGNGTLDLVFGSGHDLVVLPGHGDGTFGAPTKTYAPSGSALTLGDFNGDGKLDVVVAASGTPLDCGFERPPYCRGGALGNVSLLLGRGDGTFTVGSPFHPSWPLGVQAADLNGDHHLDLVVAGYGQSSWMDGGAFDVLLGNGDGTFRSAGSIAGTASFPTAPKLVDLNGDKELDVVFGNSAGVAVLYGTGGGTFAAPSVFGKGFFDGWVRVADFDRNGHLDVLAAGAGENPVKLLLSAACH